MSGHEPISVWDTLQEFGFLPDPEVRYSEDLPGLSFDFGNFKLEAVTGVNKWFKDVVHFGGVFANRRTLGIVEFELPRTLSSRQQLAAFLAYYLDNQAQDGDALRLELNVHWISEGRKHRHLLPWEIAAEAYRARPRCSVQRDWLRVALRDLARLITQSGAGAEVEISFDGSVLSISYSNKVLAMPAHGTPWAMLFTVPVANLTHLPRRLTKNEIEISVHEDRLLIGRACFAGAKAKTS